MSFDQDTRNALARMVAACRRKLLDDVTDQLTRSFGLHPDGTILELEQLATHLSEDQLVAARALRELLAHFATIAAGTEKDKRAAAYERLVLEISFTILNRLAALRLCEERALILESIRRGMNSDGFQLYDRLAAGALGNRYETYRLYLESLFDELAVDLGVLFDRHAPQSAIFPAERCLEEVLNELNAPALKSIWTEDETIGWIYQYFNPQEERRAMRDASSAPRNSRELAVRNQFFTPRYVVEFLTDNTLGRIWYEMQRGQTALKERCRYLVRRPDERFLGEGETAPASTVPENATQEELLKAPVYIPFRPKKDPRDLKVLDPACGSGHFLLYSYDLLETIYAEAWEDENSPASQASGKTLRQDYPARDELQRALPDLILRHNLHGIDIDRRAAQIAALALWLRAQRAWQALKLSATARPRITRSNIACAEPMPGEENLRQEFCANLKPKLLGELVERIFEKMKLAGEAGSLLKIEEEIRDVVSAAKQQLAREFEKAKDKKGNELLFTQAEIDRAAVKERPSEVLDGLNVSDAEFLARAEAAIGRALQEYAEAAEEQTGQRRLFADDAAHGFAFIELCQLRYDVVLMNPPFGDASLPSKSYLEETYGDTKGDVYKAFVECFQGRLVPAGFLGIISSRTGFFLGQSEDWRTRVVLRLFRPIALADLGSGVLDAMVEVAAYVLRSLSAQEARDLTLSLVPTLEKVARDKQGRFSLPKWQAARDGLKRHQAVAELELLEGGGFVQGCPGEFARYTALWRAGKVVRPPPKSAFPPLVCIRALAEEDKGAVLAAAVCGGAQNRTFVCNPGEFSQVPGHPFAYWAGPKVLTLFKSLPRLRSNGREAVIGASTKDDFRYLRVAWELPEASIARTREETLRNHAWVSFAKGGTSSHYYSDLYLAIQWRNDGREIKESISEYRGCRGWGYQWTAALNGHSHYFRCGLTWPRRTDGLSFRALPSGCIFGDKGPAVFVEDDDPEQLLALNGIVSSAPFCALVLRHS